MKKEYQRLIATYVCVVLSLGSLFGIAYYCYLLNLLIEYNLFYVLIITCLCFVFKFTLSTLKNLLRKDKLFSDYEKNIKINKRNKKTHYKQ